MQRKNYYEILGVARDADESEIKIAFRRLALQMHPDTNREDPLAEDRFKEINEAYEVLSHKDKRSQYDLGRDSLIGGFPFRPPPFDSWSDPFEEAFFSPFRCRGGGFGRGLGRRGRVFQGTRARQAGFAPHKSELRIPDLLLTSDEAVRGTERDLRLHTGRDTLVFTVSIPPGIQNGTLLRFKSSVQNGQVIELLFRVRIGDKTS